MDHPDPPSTVKPQTQVKVTTTPSGSSSSSSPLNHQTVSPSTNSCAADDPAAFNWDEVEVRYKQALEKADGRELDVLKEFSALSKYFNVWARASSKHDNDRVIKRLLTRQRFISQSEQSMARKQTHCKLGLECSLSSILSIHFY